MRNYKARGSALLAVVMLLSCALLSRAQETVAFAEQVEARIFALVNDFRAENNLPPLEREARLDQTARYFADYMAASGRLDHLADGKTPAARVTQRGYVYCVISENIAYEYSSRGFAAERLARNFVDGWRDSPTHRENMLDPNVTQSGLAVARSAKNEYYAAQLFGRPPGVARSAGQEAASASKSKRGARC